MTLTEQVSKTDPFPDDIAKAIAALCTPDGPYVGASYKEFHVKLCALQEMMRGKTTELLALLRRSSRHMKALSDGGYGDDILQRVARDIIRDSTFEMLTKLTAPGRSTGTLAPGASASSVDSGGEIALLVAFAAALLQIRAEPDSDSLVRFSILGAICHLLNCLAWFDFLSHLRLLAVQCGG